MKLNASDRIYRSIGLLFILLFTVAAFVPFWLVVINSFASEASMLRNGFRLWPEELSLESYQFLMAGRQLYNSYGVTLFVTVAGTFLATLVTSMFAYGVAHKSAKFGNALGLMAYISMIMGSGLVGFYILVSRWLGLKDSIWALILPYLCNPFFAFILVSSFRSLPFELNEAAYMDGANEIFIFFRIILPVSKPAIATILLFYSLQFWNDWWLALLFIDNYRLHPLQIMLRKIISEMNAASYIGQAASSYQIVIPSKTVRLATVCMTIGPIILVYPFIQKYFVKGITIGSVKG